MNLIRVSLKNIKANWRNYLSLAIYIMLAAIIFVFLNSFVFTIRENLISNLSNTLTGDMQIRSGKSENLDMFSFSSDDGETNYLNAAEIKIVEQGIKNIDSKLSYLERLRLNVYFTNEGENNTSILIGLDPKTKYYKESFVISKGRELDPEKLNEVVLAETTAQKLQVEIGDEIFANCQSKDGNVVQKSFTVVGIGNSEVLLSLTVAYTSLNSAEELLETAGYEKGERSDMILYLDDRSKADETVELLKTEMKKSDTDVLITTWESMGGLITSTLDFYTIMLYGLVTLLLIIINILLINLIIMMGLERRIEIGTLRAIGYSKLQIVRIFLIEIISVSIIFCMIGIVIGSVGVSLMSNVALEIAPPLSYVMGSKFKISLDISNIYIIIIMINGFTLLASFLPIHKAASLRPVEALSES